MKRGVAVVLVVMATIAGACGNGGGDRTPQEIVFATASETSDAGSSRLAMTIGLGEAAAAQGLPSSIEAEGSFDYESRTGLLTMGLPLQPGQPPVDVEMRLIGNVMYMKFPAEMSAAFGGKPWVKIDLQAAAEASGADLGALSSAAAADPTQSLAQLRGVSDDVTEVGEEELRGVKVTHYKLTINVEKAIAETPEAQREMVRSQLEKLGTDTLPAEVWIDDDGRLRKMTQQVTVEGAGTTEVTIELFDFGIDVDVEAPDEVDVVDLTSMLTATTQQGAAGQQ
jgi:hypothetical protein